MKISMQCFTEFGNFANPYDMESDVFHGTLKECKAEFDAWKETHLEYYELKDLVKFRGEGPGICANCYHGDTIGEYPDFQLTLGKRGAVRISST